MKKTLAIVCILLTAIALTQTIAEPPTTTQAPLTAPNRPAWWSTSWRFRTTLTIDASRGPSINQILISWIPIPYGRTINMFRDLRLIDQNLAEVPSTVLYEEKQSIFTTGAAILFTTTMPPGTTQQFQVYYGNPTANPPAYRRNRLIQEYNNGLVDIGLGQGDETFAYRGEPYSNLYTTRFRYNNTLTNDYGSIIVASNRLTPVANWLLDPATNSTFSAYQAGTLIDLRVLKSAGKTLAVSDLLVNQGNSLATNVLVADLFDATAMSTRGLVVGGYNSTDNIAFASVGTNTIGIKGEQTPIGFDVDSPSNAISQVQSMTFTNKASATGDVSLALEWAMGNIPAGGHTLLARHLTVEAGYSNLTKSLSTLVQTPSTMPSAEEALPSPIPSAYALFASQVPVQGLNVQTGGYTISHTPSNTTWVSTSASLTGAASYSLPGPGDYDFESPTIWSASPSSNVPGHYVSYSSPRSWSEERGSYTAAIHLWDNDTTSVQGSVSSRLLNVVGAQSVSLWFNYRLKYNLTGGQPSSYVSLSIDRNLDNIPDSVCFVSINGTLPLCNPANPTLIGDGQWHSSQIDLSNLNLPEDFKFGINLFASTNGLGPKGTGPLATGIVELDVDNIYLQVSGTAQDVYSVNLDPYTNTVSVNYARQGLNTAVLNPTANVTFAYTTVAPLSLVVEPKGQFLASLSANDPSALFLNESALVLGTQMGTFQEARLNSVLLSASQYFLSNQTLVIFRSALQAVQGSSQLSPLTLVIDNNYHTLAIQAQDANGDLVSNVNFSALDTFGRTVITNTTRTTGTELTLVPFTYTLQGTFHGVTVYSLPLSLSNDQSLTPKLPIFRINFAVRDLFNSAITGADMSLARNGTVYVTEATDRSGQVSAQLAANTPYTITLSLQGQQLLERGFTPSINNLKVELDTSYAPLPARIAVAGMVMVAAVAVVVVVRRRYRI